MPLVSGLVPARFLVLTAHLVIVITIFWSRVSLFFLVSIPGTFFQIFPLCSRSGFRMFHPKIKIESLRSQMGQLPVSPHTFSRMIVALSVTLGLFVVELAGFLSGVSMFNNAQSLLCILP
ncbi:PREDICTED: transmembrane protein 107 [Thamnophis sirtalis]|uniref:Transmembrane protein 107 n=1 Tax=Thamnophis sirtalis TaxID=35019 RepID=A0A6I9Y1V7_9SAUR|nr:PREDICTED: transmembrane protein 107 [Thamnophis sirtalis]